MESGEGNDGVELIPFNLVFLGVILLATGLLMRAVFCMEVVAEDTEKPTVLCLGETTLIVLVRRDWLIFLSGDDLIDGESSRKDDE